MLTKRQNLLETIRGGNPDRFVNQYEAFVCQDTIFGRILGDPVQAASTYPVPGGQATVNAWGVTIAWPEGMPGPFPVHDDKHKVLKDITKWEKVVKAPKLDYLMGMDDCLINFYEEPEAMKELIEYISDWEVDTRNYFARIFILTRSS